MMTRSLHVREAFPADMPACGAIAAANNMPGWAWPLNCWGAVAELDERVVAFCAGRDVVNGLVVEDLWAQPGPDGIRGLGRLAEWVESEAQKLADKRGEEVGIGGIVFPHNTRHRAALEKRGYAFYAEVLAKKVQPHV